jgi:hypothetical protein
MTIPNPMRVSRPSSSGKLGEERAVLMRLLYGQPHAEATRRRAERPARELILN